MNEKLKVEPWNGSSLPLETEISLPGDIILGNSAELGIDNNSSLILYLDGDFEAKSFEQKNSGTFNYDVLLRDVGINDEALYFTITNWSE